MQEKINIIQFLPYFPPHKGGLETVAEEIWKYWVKNNFWDFINIVTEFEQKKELKNNEKIIFEWEIIWYKKAWVEVLVCPSIELINNFPVYKFWDKKYKIIKKYIKNKIWENKNNFRIITHTRFFLTSLFWWIFARKNKIKWIHIEHWSDYVKLSNKFKSFIAFVYDKILWKWIFKKADKILAISEACKSFINREFLDREIEVFYRGLDIPEKLEKVENLKEKFKNKIIIWYLWRLYKWKNIETLIKAYYKLDNALQDKVQIVIVWDGEDFERLENLDKDNKIYFTWWKTFKEALAYQKQFDIHFHTSSPWWWLATTLLQAMHFWNLIVATPNEWAKEVIENNKNWFLLKNDSIEEIKRWIKLWVENLWKKEEFSIENKKIIEEKFKWKNNILKLYNLVK